MRVLVTGATSRLGRALVARLVQAGHHLRATSRRAYPGQHGVEWTVADLASGAGLARAVAGVDEVVHLASAPYKGAYTVRVDVDGTRRLGPGGARSTHPTWSRWSAPAHGRERHPRRRPDEQPGGGQQVA